LQGLSKLIDSAVTDSDGLGIDHQGRGTLTIKNSEISGNDDGIIISESKAFIINSTVNSNFGRISSSISNGGTLHLYHSTVSNTVGTGGGGGISNRGTLIVKHSSIINNSTSEQAGGGGIINGGVAIIEDSLIAGNIGGFALGGGGIINRGRLTLIRSTVRGNSVPGDVGFFSGLGGGIYNTGAGARLRLIGTLVTQNVASVDGGGVFNDGGTVLQTKTLIINNTPNDCVGC
jgi:hypothetical protein